MYTGRKLNIIPVFLVLLQPFLTVVRAATRNTERDLIEYIFSNYNKGARPVTDPSHQIEVSFGFELKQVINVDEHEEAMFTKLWVRQSWVNALMKWDSKQWHGINETTVDPNLVWVPDIVLYNNADNAFSGGTEKYKTRVQLWANGTHIWLSPAVFKSTCDISVKYFPFDQQKCLLTFGSWAFENTKLKLKTTEANITSSEYVISSEWKLADVKKSMNVTQYENSTYDVMTYTIKLTRRPLYYVFNVLFPCFILVLTILFSFFLPPESGERITLVMTILLTFSVFLHTINETLPPSSDAIPTLGIFCIIMMVEIGFSLVTTSVVLIINAKAGRTDTADIPTWIRIIFLGIIANLLNFKRPVGKRKGCNKLNLCGNGDDEKRVLANNAETSIQIMLNRCVDMGYKLEENDEVYLTFKTIHDKRALANLLEELRTINAALHNQLNLEYNQSEWRFLCQIVDRLIFYIFFLTVVSSAFTILVPVYMIHS